MATRNFSRRRFLGTSTAAAALLGAPYVRTSRAAGKLEVGFWDHWVPAANDALTKLCNEWAAKEKVDIKIDYITSQGNKLLMTAAAEAQASAGHDILTFGAWTVGDKARYLEPVDDLMKALTAANGSVSPLIEYLSRINGRWVAIPKTPGSQLQPPCARIDLFKQHAGLDITAMYPAGGAPDKAMSEAWTWDAFLAAAQKCHKAGFPFGIGLGQTNDSVSSVGAIFSGFGAQLVDAKGNITVNSAEVRQALDYMRRLAAFLPPDAPAWDDSANNKWLITGRGALIMNPPSAWAVAKRDNPKIAEQLWTFPAPHGPKGQYQPYLPQFLGIWKFSKNKAAAKSLLLHLSTREATQRVLEASRGYDVPAFAKFADFRIWSEEGPPKGTLHHYPPKAGQILSISGYPAPHSIGYQIYNQAIVTKLVVKYAVNGEPMDKAIGWAAAELEGFRRT